MKSAGVVSKSVSLGHMWCLLPPGLEMFHSKLAFFLLDQSVIKTCYLLIHSAFLYNRDFGFQVEFRLLQLFFWALESSQAVSSSRVANANSPNRGNVSLQFQVKMTTEINKFAGFTHLCRANQPLIIYPEVSSRWFCPVDWVLCQLSFDKGQHRSGRHGSNPLTQLFSLG